MGLKDKVIYHVSEDFFNWWKTTIIGNDRESRMLLAWWGWEACEKFYKQKEINDGEKDKEQDTAT